MTEPASGFEWPRSKAQLWVLDQIGCGNNSPMMAKSTRDALLRKGLIVKMEDGKMSAFGGLMMRVERFDMPLAVHLVWCATCEDDAPTPTSTNTGDGDGR